MLDLGSLAARALVAVMLTTPGPQKQRLALDVLIELGMTLPLYERLALAQKLAFACSTSGHPEVEAEWGRLKPLFADEAEPPSNCEQRLAS